MNTSSRYLTAIHILTLLAEKNEPLSSSFIAMSVGVNPVTIRKAISKLRHCGYVNTTAGVNGGARLAKSADEISLRELYELLSESDPFGLYPPNADQRCVVGRHLSGILEDVHNDAHQLMIDKLGESTIADLVVEIQKRE